MPDYEVDVTVSFEVRTIVRDCTDGSEYGEAEELICDLIRTQDFPLLREGIVFDVEAWQSLEIEKGESNGNTS